MESDKPVEKIEEKIEEQLEAEKVEAPVEFSPEEMRMLEAAIQEPEDEDEKADELGKTFLDVLREKWDKFSLQSNAGSAILKIIMALIIFEICRVTAFYGMQFEKSPITNFYTFIEGNEMIMLGCMAAIALLWLLSPGLGSCLYLVLLYASMGGVSPIIVGISALLILLFSVESRLVSFGAILMPVLTICLTEEQWVNFVGEGVTGPFGAHLLFTTSLGVFITLFTAFASARTVGGSTRTLAFVQFACLSFAFAQLVRIKDAAGEHNILSFKRSYWPLFTSESAIKSKVFDEFTEYLMYPGLRILAVYFVIGILFLIFINLKIGKKKPQIDIRDGIGFAITCALLVAARPVIVKLTGLELYDTYAIPEVAVQALLAFVVTRPIAGRLPTQAGTVVSGAKHFIFISYAHNDLKRVKPYLQILRKEGFDFWYDDNIRAGTEWQDVIASNLANCSYFLAFVSESSIHSDYCTKEINYATSKKKPMTAILLDNVDLPPVLEMHMASLQAIERRKYSSDKACLQVVMGLEEIQPCRIDK